MIEGAAGGRSVAAPVIRPDRLGWAALAAGLLLLGAAAMIFGYAPTEAVQGEVQRIFYLHVACAIAAYIAFAFVLLAGVAYLWRGAERADAIGHSAAEIGLLLTSVTLVMGMLWARPIWGTYWVWWDARLVATMVLWMTYAGYLLVRRVTGPGRQGARFGAVVGIVGFINVPIVHFSVEWWRTIHPPPVLNTPTGPGLPPSMLVTFMVTLVAVIAMSLVLGIYRYRLGRAQVVLARRLEAAGMNGVGG